LAEAGFDALLGRTISPETRLRLLAGSPAGRGVRVCACVGVSEAASAMPLSADGLHSLAELGAVLSAGTNCGSCVPEQEKIPRDVRQPAA
jgi:assimilatory nitrate reductase catalytic subunit